MNGIDVLADGFSRVHGSAHAAVVDLTPEQLAWRADPEANSIAWLVWHLARVQDDHVAQRDGRAARVTVRWQAGAVQHPEQVVLVDDRGRPVGVADKTTVHGRHTPRHLAFSCYGFDAAGRVLVTQRSRVKQAFPLVWTGTCCGHPAPGEDLADAVHRRLDHELGVRAHDLRLVLPDFSYRAADRNGVEEHEFCPVFVCTLDADPCPRPGEVETWEWWSWERFLDAAAAGELSPWAALQAPLLAELDDPRTRRTG